MTIKLQMNIITQTYESRIGAWASKQSSELKDRDELLKSLEDLKKNIMIKVKCQDLVIGRVGI